MAAPAAPLAAGPLPSAMLVQAVTLAAAGGLVALLVLVSLRRLNAGRTRRCDCGGSLAGRVLVVTGASSGIGLEAVRLLLARRPARLVLGVRRPAEVERLVRPMLLPADPTDAAGTTELLVLQLDLLSVDSVCRFACELLAAVDRLDALVLNAGAGAAPGRHLTGDGLEMQFQGNHLSHFLLFRLLRPLLLATGERTGQPSRVIVTSSLAHRLGRLDLDNLPSADRYVQHPFRTYADTKLCNVLFTTHLQRRLTESRLADRLTAVCFSPGTVYTNGVRDNGLWYVRWPLLVLCFVYGRSAADAAENILHLCLRPHPEAVGGRFFENCLPSQAGGQADDPLLAERLWRLCDRLCDERLADGRLQRISSSCRTRRIRQEERSFVCL